MSAGKISLNGGLGKDDKVLVLLQILNIDQLPRLRGADPLLFRLEVDVDEAEPRRPAALLAGAGPARKAVSNGPWAPSGETSQAAP